MRLFSPLNFDLYTRYYFLPCNRCSLNIEKASVQILLNVYFEENIELIESMLLVEWLTGVRPYIKTIKFVSLGLKPGKNRYNKGFVVYVGEKLFLGVFNRLSGGQKAGV